MQAPKNINQTSRIKTKPTQARNTSFSEYMQIQMSIAPKEMLKFHSILITNIAKHKRKLLVKLQARAHPVPLEKGISKDIYTLRNCLGKPKLPAGGNSQGSSYPDGADELPGYLLPDVAASFFKQLPRS